MLFPKLLASCTVALMGLFLTACQSPPRAAAPTPPPEVFRSITFDEATAAAAAENKPLFIYFDGDWAEQSVELLTKILPAEESARLLRERTVAVHIDVTAAPELTKKYHVQDVPLLLLVSADGREIDRWTDFDSPQDFVQEVTASLAGQTSVAQLRAKLKPTDLDGRFRLAQKLITIGNLPDALDELVSLWSEPKLETWRSGRRHVSRHKIIVALGALQKSYPPARDQLLKWRDENEAAILAEPDKSKAPIYISDIDTALADDSHLVGFFQKLPAQSRAYKILKGACFKVYVRLKAFPEAAALLTAEEAITLATRKTDLPLVVRGIVHVILPFQGGSAIKSYRLRALLQNVTYFVPYAATSQIDPARKIALAIIEEDKTKEAPRLIRQVCKQLHGDKADAFIAQLAIPAVTNASEIATKK